VGITPGNQYLAAGKQRRGVAEASIIHAAGYGPCVAGGSIQEASVTGRASAATIGTPRPAGQYISGIEKRGNGGWPCGLQKWAGAGPGGNTRIVELGFVGYQHIAVREKYRGGGDGGRFLHAGSEAPPRCGWIIKLGAGQVGGGVADSVVTVSDEHFAVLQQRCPAGARNIQSARGLPDARRRVVEFGGVLSIWCVKQ
jgi:hypothetical protein